MQNTWRGQRTGRWTALPRAVFVGALCLLSGACAHESRSIQQADQRVRYYSQKVTENPRSFAAHAQLASAYLGKARATHDPAFLARARAAAAESMDIQSNYLALKTMAAICGYSHRFAEAIDWANRAAAADPADPEMTSMRVEAYLGLGQRDNAVALLPVTIDDARDFHTAAAWGLVCSSEGRVDDAVAAYRRAGEFARAESAPAFEVWALVMASGAYIDAGRVEDGQPLLDAAAEIDPTDTLLRIHRAEVAEAQGRFGDALDAYASLLRESDDPAIHAAAWRVARAAGDEGIAAAHFAAAERGFKRVIDAGEVYTLEALAKLYVAAEVNLEAARDLAKRNLEFKRDASAMRAYEEAVAARR
ncbi:MAG: hypothetical protein KDA32_06785 [Phycisphaerales bacterium]|nr:hypothetical protein [Phycisphaerales bacterium]